MLRFVAKDADGRAKLRVLLAHRGHRVGHAALGGGEQLLVPVEVVEHPVHLPEPGFELLDAIEQHVRTLEDIVDHLAEYVRRQVIDLVQVVDVLDDGRIEHALRAEYCGERDAERLGEPLLQRGVGRAGAEETPFAVQPFGEVVTGPEAIRPAPQRPLGTTPGGVGRRAALAHRVTIPSKGLLAVAYIRFAIRPAT
jgi:hypothetical protein